MASAFSRRTFLSGFASGSALLLAGCGKSAFCPAGSLPEGPADVTLRIGRVQAEVAKGHVIPTVGYNGATPGPLIRLREGTTVTVDLFNDTDVPELVHWHGLVVPVEVDGAAEEKSLQVPAHGHPRYRMTPQPAGARFVHSHAMAMANFERGPYSGQFGFVCIEPRQNARAWDQEVFLATHEWEPKLSDEEEMEDEDITPAEKQRKAEEDRKNKPNGWEIGYELFSINGKALGFGEPVRVREGQRVLFHILNGSATENIRLALPGHTFQVVALDGNPVPKPGNVEVLELGTAERISALVEMKNPGVWVLGTPADDDRRNGMGIVVEYANRSGEPRWVRPKPARWDYTMFGETRAAAAPDETIQLSFGKINGGKGGFNQWTINGRSFDEKDAPHILRKGARYRLVFDNQTDDPHPVHLHRSRFELTNVYGKATAGVMKDVVLVKGYRKIEADVVPEMEGLTLFHCHQQFHMDYGFKTLFNVR